MQKVYLLLRDNKQSGPYSLDELVQLGLRPFDLVWVEGRSSGWAYPSEINALKPYVPGAPASVQQESTESMPSTPPTYKPADTVTPSSPKDIPPPKSVFVSLPGKGTQPVTPKKEVTPQKEAPPASDWDRRVEEARQRAQAHAHTYAPVGDKEEDIPSLNTNYARSLDEVEEEYTSWVYKQKAKKKPVFSGRQVAVLAIAVLLLGGGYLVVTSLGGSSKPEEQSLVTLPQAPSTEESGPEAEPANSAVVYEDQAQQEEPVASTTEATKKEVKRPTKPLTTGTVAQRPEEQVQSSAQRPDAHLPAPERTIADEPVEEEVAATTPQQKKKTLADKIDGFIEKIASKGPSKTPKEEVEETPRTGPAPESGERRSTRRGEEGAAVPDRAELARQVDVVANNSDNWMMGVKDLKLTVRNYNTVALKSATVEVAYYSESDELLEKKTVKVSNIPAKGRKTVAAPDQRLADHVELKVLSVSADEEAYAQQ
jgi:hypothetical protein